VTNCFAAGFNADDRTGISRTLIEQWDGIAWSIVASPNRASWDTLSDVTCTSATSCVAVGFYSNGIANQTLIEQWDGISWSITTSPNNGTLNGVTCTSATNCFAVGEYFNGTDYAEE